jgi:hypothetical protein
MERMNYGKIEQYIRLDELVSMILFEVESSEYISGNGNARWKVVKKLVG